MAAIEHSYKYPFASRLDESSDAPRLRLATSIGTAASPYFFSGRLVEARRTAEQLLTISGIAARRFFLPPSMVARILRNADPVVTCGDERLRFESFSVCGGVYARCDLRPEAVDGQWLGRGTTNVDFNPPMRNALAQILDGDKVGLNVGADAVELERETGSVVERRVKLPVRWLRGFVEVQCYQSAMTAALELSPADARRLIQGLPRDVPYAGPPAYLVAFGRTVRISQRSAPGAIAVGGPARLRVLLPLLRGAQSVRVYRHDSGASAFELVYPESRFHLVLSPDAARGFSGEGQALRQLAAGGGRDVLPRVHAALRWQTRLRPQDLARDLGLHEAQVAEALATLGARGIVGFDLEDKGWFHRELPFDLSLVEELQPRLVDARALVAGGGVRITQNEGPPKEAWVQGSEVEHRVLLDGEEERCTCPWSVRNHGARGPCKHILAARIALGAPEEFE